jgi:hypothetical protein
VSDEELAERVQVAIVRKPIDGHAYSKGEIAKLRKIFDDISSIDWPDHLLHRHTDEFALYVGWQIRREPTKPARERIREVTSQLCRPAESLLCAITKHDVSRELKLSWGGYRDFDIESFEQHLRQFINATDRHLQELKRTSRKGKPLDSDLKQLFVDTASMLCEVIDKNFEPQRGTKIASAKLEEVTNLLGPALFRGKMKYDGARRNLVDRWNKNLRRLKSGELRITNDCG